MNALTAPAGESLELYGDVLMNPTFPDKELERLRGQTLAAIQQEKAQPQAIINRLVPKLLFGEGHAYANPASGTGTEEAVSSLKSADLAAFYKRWVRPDNSTLLVVGDTTLAADPAAARAALRRLACAGRSQCRRRTSPTWRCSPSRACSSSTARARSSRRSWP